jgi:NDP-sugar pyrophosphorylase family protein
MSSTDVLILCGGQGTRFRAIREDIPKALAPIRGNPFIDLLLDDLVSQGFRRLILATGFMSNQIEHHVKLRNDAEYIISCEPQPLGTGGAIKYAEPHFRSDPVLVMNGDSRIECIFSDLLSFHLTKQAEMTMLLSKVTRGIDYGNVELNNDDRIVKFLQKPVAGKNSLVNAGVYLINIGLLESQWKNHNYSLEKDWLPIWVNSNNVFGYTSEVDFYDIGTPERYNSFCNNQKKY